MIGDRIGFVDPASVPCPDGRQLPIGSIQAAHESITANYRDAVTRKKATDDGITISAAADLLGPGVIEVPRFETEILDMVRRRGVLGQRIQAVPATGQPSRYFEQRTIASGAFTDPRNITQTAETPFRAERYFPVKAISGQMNFNMFDVEVTRLQGTYGALVAKDVTDLISGCLRTSDKALWRGTDTSLAVPTTLQYMGGFGVTFGNGQINRTFSIDSTGSLVDATKSEVASIISNEEFEAKPTAIYCHPQTQDLFEQEERLNHRQMSTVGVTGKDGSVIAGLEVSALNTSAGKLPIISDWAIPAPVTPGQEGAGSTDYFFAIVTEPLIEYHYVVAAEPRVYVLGLEGNLATQYVCVMFGAPIFKGKAETSDPEGTPVTYAHSLGRVTRTS